MSQEVSNSDFALNNSESFNDLEHEPALPVYRNDELYGDSSKMEEIIVGSYGATDSQLPMRTLNVKQLPKKMLSYLKKNWIFLVTILAMWLILGVRNDGNVIYKIPVVSQIYGLLTSNPLHGILVYVTATYNGPVGFFDGGLSPYTFMVALAGKSAYLLAMTGVIIPSVKALLKNRNREMDTYRNIFRRVIDIAKSLAGSLNKIGFALAGCGMAFMISNLLTRNGKIDKTFVLFLLSFVMLKGLNGAMPSVLDFIARYTIAFFIRLMPSGISKGSDHNEVLRVGIAIGFVLAVIFGSFDENACYIIGGVLIISGSILTIINKETVQ